MTTYLRIASGVMLVLFLSWAGFQYNDPDALLWAAIYCIAALLTLLFLLGKSPSSASIAYVFLCVLYAGYLAIRIILDREFIFEEQGREMLGLLICAGWITFLVSRSRSARPASTAI
jgi:hypothetical protein